MTRHPIFKLQMSRSYKGIDLGDLSSAVLLTGVFFLVLKNLLDGFPLLLLIVGFYFIALRIPALWRKIAPPHALEHFLMWVLTPEKLEIGADTRPLPLSVMRWVRPLRSRRKRKMRPSLESVTQRP